MADFFVGASVSLLSISTTLLIGAGCFALGFLFAHKETKSCLPFPFSWIRSLADNKRVALPADDGPGEPKFVERAVQKKPALLEIENLAEILEDFKMVGQYVIFLVLIVPCVTPLYTETYSSIIILLCSWNASLILKLMPLFAYSCLVPS